MKPWLVAVLFTAALCIVPAGEVLLGLRAVRTATAEACMGATRFVVLTPAAPPARKPVPGEVHL